MEEILRGRCIISTCALLAFAIISAFLGMGCAGKTYTYNSVYSLSDRNLVERKQAANRGDSQAAFDVYLHYKFGSNNQDPSQALYWLKKSVDLGNTTAARHLQTIEQQR